MVERIWVQPRLLEVLKDLPTCTGVRRDVVGIEEFYTLISRESVELNGFVDLSAMSAATGFKLIARNMTALGVQVVGMVYGDYLGLIFLPVSRTTGSVWIYLLLRSCRNNNTLIFIS